MNDRSLVVYCSACGRQIGVVTKANGAVVLETRERWLTDEMARRFNLVTFPNTGPRRESKHSLLELPAPGAGGDLVGVPCADGRHLVALDLGVLAADFASGKRKHTAHPHQ